MKLSFLDGRLEGSVIEPTSRTLRGLQLQSTDQLFAVLSDSGSARKLFSEMDAEDLLMLHAHIPPEQEPRETTTWIQQRSPDARFNWHNPYLTSTYERPANAATEFVSIEDTARALYNVITSTSMPRQLRQYKDNCLQCCSYIFGLQLKNLPRGMPVLCEALRDIYERFLADDALNQNFNEQLIQEMRRRELSYRNAGDMNIALCKRVLHRVSVPGGLGVFSYYHSDEAQNPNVVAQAFYKTHRGPMITSYPGTR